IDDVVFTTDGDALAGVLRSNHTFLWDVTRDAATAVAVAGAPNQVRLSPDARRAAASDGERTWLVDARSGERIGGERAGTDPAFSSDGRSLAVSSYAGTVRVEDARDGSTT